MTHGGAPLPLNFSKHSSVLLVAVAILAVSCGGGGGGGGSGGGSAAPTSNTASLSLSGAPPGQILVGEPVRFAPSVNNPQGRAMTFSASNLPDWLSINTATGVVTGVPDASNVGTYRNIRITVEAGGATSTSHPYTIEVVAVASGSVTLTWIPPTQNADGSPLQNLAGYRIYFGRSPKTLTRSVTIESSGVTSVVVDNLTPAVWHFAATAINADGVESGLSNIAVLKIM